MKCLKWLLFVSFLTCSGPWLRGDTLTGEIRGQVKDVGSGAPLTRVRMTLTNVSRGWQKQVTTDSFGRYVFLQLEPGNYRLSASQDGYYSLERTDILIRLNRLKVVVPPFELRKLVATPTRQITLRGEQTKTAIVDLAAAGPSPPVIAIIREVGETAMVSLGDGSLRFNFENRLLLGLPLRGGRTFDQMALLSPGVYRVPFSKGEGPAVGLGVGSPGQFSVNGQRGRSNNFTVDGSDNNDEDIGVRRQGFVALVSQGAESVEEFQILTAGFPAEFGRNSGSMVNAVSRSGGADTHGSLVGLFNHNVLNARDFFDTPFSDSVNLGDLDGGVFNNDDFSDTQLAGTLGGTAVREKLFYFLSAERRSFSGSRIAHFVVPSSAERGLRTAKGFVPIEELGAFFADNRINYSDVAGAGIFSLYPLPNNPDGPFGEHNYSQVKNVDGEALMFSIKGDWYLARDTNLSARYNFTDDEALLPFTGNSLNSSLPTETRTQNLALFLNTTTGSWGNSLRASYGRTDLSFPAEEGSPFLFGSQPEKDSLFVSPPIQTEYGLFGPFGATGPIGQLSIMPYNSIGIDAFNFPQGRVDNTYQVGDSITFVGERHVLKWGVDFRRSELNSFSDRNSRPLVLFTPGVIASSCLTNPTCLFATDDGLLSGTDAAALGAPGGFLQNISTQPVPDSTLGLRFSQWDFFFQDDWKVSENFALNLGIRYEYQTVPTDGQNRIEDTFSLSPEDFLHLPVEGSPEDQRTIAAGNESFDLALKAWNEVLGGRSKIYRPDQNNFAPRLGFAWDPQGKGKTVIRGGYSLSYDATIGAVTSRSRSVFPTFVPLNLDLNFLPPTGLFLNSPIFLEFTPTDERLIKEGTLNSYNLAETAFATALGALLVKAPAIAVGSLSSNGLAFTLPEAEPKTTSAHHLLFGLEQQFLPSHLVAFRYVGSRGRHLTRFSTPNAGLVSTPVLFSSPVLGPLLLLDIPPSTSAEGLGRPNLNLGSYTIFENSASSEYHSLQVSYERRFSRGLQYQLHWTWGHVLDEVSDPFTGRGYFALPQDISNPGQEWASASFDARHRVVGFVYWTPQFSQAPLFKDWRISMILEAQTGQPFTINSTLDRNFDGNLTDRLDSVEGITVNSGSVQNLNLRADIAPIDLLAARNQPGRVSRNSFRTDGIFQLDASVGRRFSFAEGVHLELRCEAFNLFNKTHFAVPVRILESPGFGTSFDTQVGPRKLRFMAQLTF